MVSGQDSDINIYIQKSEQDIRKCDMGIKEVGWLGEIGEKFNSGRMSHK